MDGDVKLVCQDTYPHWDCETRIVTLSPAHKVTRQAEYELSSHGPTYTRRYLQSSLETPSWIFIPGPVLICMHDLSQSNLSWVSICAPSEGPRPRLWSKSTAFAASKLSSPDAYVSRRLSIAQCVYTVPSSLYFPPKDLSPLLPVRVTSLFNSCSGKQHVPFLF